MNVTKYHKIFSLALAVLFLIAIQIFAAPRPIFRFLVPAFFVYLFILTAYNRWYLVGIQKYNPWVALRPVLLFASAFGIWWFLPTELLRGAFLILTAAIGGFVEYFLGNFSENVLINETLLISFGIFAAMFGYNMYYPPFHYWFIGGCFLGTALTSRAFYEFIPQDAGAKIISSLVIALFCTELFWALSFLPLHYSAQALLLFNIFYFCLILNYYQLYKTLNIKKIQFHFMLMLIASVLILLATPWRVLG